MQTLPIGSICTSIIPAHTTAPPSGFLVCNGQNVSRTSFSALLNVVGAANLKSSPQHGEFGVGNGATTFQLPDLRGYFLRGADDMGGAIGRDPDWASRNGGSVVGSTQGDGIRSSMRHLYSNPHSGSAFISPNVSDRLQIKHTSYPDGYGNEPAVIFDATFRYVASGIGSNESWVVVGDENETRPLNLAIVYMIKSY